MKKIIALVLVMLMCASLMAACGSSSSAPAASSQSSAPAAPAAPAADKKVLKVATNVAFPPYEYYENEKAVGIDIEIMEVICEKLGYEMEVDDMEFGSVIIAVQTGKADVGVGGITITEERKKSVDFTVPYDAGIQSVIVTENSEIKDVADLGNAGVKIGVQQDTTGDIFCTEDFGEDHMARFNKGADAVQALITGKCQAVVIDNGPAKTFVAQNAGLKLLPTAYYQEDYGFEISKENPELYKQVNDTLQAMLDDGTVAAIIAKYTSDTAEEAPAEIPADAKTIVVATNVAFPPYEYYENEVATGIDIEIMQTICNKLGYNMEVSDMEFGSIIIAVQTGKVDVGVGAITITEERKKSIDFTVPYDAGIQSVIVLENSEIASVEDLAKAAKIGVQQDTTGDIFCTEDFGEEHVARFNKGADAVQALLTGKCQAVVIDNGPAKTFVEQHAGLKLLPTAYYQEDYGFEISKNNPELYAQINGALEELIADGTVAAIIAKYTAA